MIARNHFQFTPKCRYFNCKHNNHLMWNYLFSEGLI
jgi:hypothetical protein